MEQSEPQLLLGKEADYDEVLHMENLIDSDYEDKFLVKLRSMVSNGFDVNYFSLSGADRSACEVLIFSGEVYINDKFVVKPSSMSESQISIMDILVVCVALILLLSIF